MSSGKLAKKPPLHHIYIYIYVLSKLCLFFALCGAVVLSRSGLGIRWPIPIRHVRRRCYGQLGVGEVLLLLAVGQYNMSSPDATGKPLCGHCLGRFNTTRGRFGGPTTSISVNSGFPPCCHARSSRVPARHPRHPLATSQDPLRRRACRELNAGWLPWDMP